MAKATPTVFISHASSDKSEATKLHDALKKVGINAHLDQVELEYGDNIITWINNSVQESDYLLILVSTNSIGRYWVEIEWSAALMKEADLRRTFVIPVVLPGVSDNQIPILLKAKLFIDFRNDKEASLLKLVNRIKQDEQIARDRGRLPTPAPLTAQQGIFDSFSDSEEWIEVIVFSSRFGRKFRFTVPKKATPSYLLAMLRDCLNLKWSNIDENIFVELSYTYAIGFNGDHLSLDTPLSEAGVTNGSILELWIKVTLTDLLEDSKKIADKSLWLKGAGQDKFHLLKSEVNFVLSCYKLLPYINESKILNDEELKKESNRIIEIIMNDRNFTSAQIAMIAKKYFDHVDA